MSQGPAKPPTRDHGALTGLTDDDHTQYLLASGSRAMSGDLNMGSNNILSVGRIGGFATGARDSGGATNITNTAYANLNALTASPNTFGNLAVTKTTGTVAIVIISAQIQADSSGNFGIMSVAVSGASTFAANDAWSIVHNSANSEWATVSRAIWFSGLTAGSNTFTVQARVSGGTGPRMERVDLVVIPV